MAIGKPGRILLQSMLTGIVTGLVGYFAVHRLGVLGALVAIPTLLITSFVFGEVASALDDWLRRVTRDPLWLMTEKGRSWQAGERRAP